MAKSTKEPEIETAVNIAEQNGNEEYLAERPARKPRRKPRTIVDPNRVHAHLDVGSISAGGVTVSQTDEGKPEFDIKWGADERTWSFAVPAHIAMQMLEQCEFTSSHAAGVPLTYDEKIIAEQEKADSEVQVGKMAKALAQIAADEVAKSE